KAERQQGTGVLSLRAALLLAMLLLWTAIAFADTEPLPKLKERAESAHGGHRAELMMEAARREMETADENFTKGDVEKARSMVGDCLTDADKAAHAAIESGQRLKKTELELRRLRHRTEEVRRTLAVDDRPQLEKA